MNNENYPLIKVTKDLILFLTYKEIIYLLDISKEYIL